MGDLFCNCYHSKQDHKELETGFNGWCIYSTYGQCPCDCYTQMTNLELLEYLDERNRNL